MNQTPHTGSYILKWQDDTLEIKLSTDPAVEGRAALRTNIGNASIRRREIIDQTENGTTPLAKAWHDIPMEKVSPGLYSVKLRLEEVGVFSAKAFFEPSRGSEIQWPEGENMHVKVAPRRTRRANTIYTCFPRQFGATASHTEKDAETEKAVALLDSKGYNVIPGSGTFRDVIRKLPVIMDEMGFNILQLLPVFPVPTTFARMGRFGCPFAATDFLSVDPACAEFDRSATPIDQFGELADAVHARGGLLFIDLPANHTGWAATLQTHHPEWYHREADGRFVSPGAWGVVWEDLVELDYSNAKLRSYMAEVFLFWCAKGVDGFRCDAGYMIPASTWEYIVSRVREEYPETVFMLEGLGGKISVTEDLLSRAGLDWAYSEIFQTYDRGAFEWYLPGAIEMSERCGPLVHFAETHDNDRLAKGGSVYARMRVGLCALLSHQGAWGMANGVEWFATEKIDVHGSSSLNWGANVNMKDFIASLNRLLSSHPAFGPDTHLEMIQQGAGNFLAVKRTWNTGKTDDSVLVLVNLDSVNKCIAHWDGGKFPPQNCHDLLSGREFKVCTCPELELEPGAVLCLSASSETTRSEESLIKEGREIPGRCEADLLETVFSWPRDVKRDVPVPCGNSVKIVSPRPFRARIHAEGKVIASLESTQTDSGSYSARFSPGEYRGDGTRVFAAELEMSVYDRVSATAEHTHSRLAILPPGEKAMAALSVDRAFLRENPYAVTVLSNGSGADSFARLAWGETAYRYDSLFSANPNCNAPGDRLVLWTACRAWLQHEGYSREINKDCLSRFTADPAGRFAMWFFRVPCGMGKQCAFAFHLSLADGANAARLTVKRFNSGVDDVEGSVRIVFRPDIEWRSFHELTKAYAGPENLFPSSVKPRSDGFDFSPYAEDRRLVFDVTGGVFNFDPQWRYMTHHPVAEERGQEATCDLFSPGWIAADFKPDGSATMKASYTADKGAPDALFPKVPASGKLVALESANPLSGVRTVLSEALNVYIQKSYGLETVLAGYPWFLDWGRDTLIFLRALVADGRTDEASKILAAFAGFEKDGMIPNIIFGGNAGNWDTSDAPLWLVAVAGDLVGKLGDKVLSMKCGAQTLKRVVSSILDNYMKGTPNGIKVDEASMLVWSPVHFTWMDTNYPAGTPREGYPVEIQALWINALRFAAKKIDRKWAAVAETAARSMVEYFTLPGGGFADCLRASCGTRAADAVKEDAVRPNQLLAVTLGALPPGDASAARSILGVCSQLNIPGGNRSLADADTVCDFPVYGAGGALLNNPHHPYFGRYTGDEDTSRKPAYHNGTVWGWTFPMYAEAAAATALVDGNLDRNAKLRVCESALSLLAGAVENLNAGCVAHISENADGDAPHAQKGSPAQAWSDSEVLRVWIFIESAIENLKGEAKKKRRAVCRK